MRIAVVLVVFMILDPWCFHRMNINPRLRPPPWGETLLWRFVLRLFRHAAIDPGGKGEPRVWAGTVASYFAAAGYLGVKTPLKPEVFRRHHTRMKKSIHRIGIQMFPIAASIVLSSCIVPAYPGDNHHASAGGSYGVYTVLPDSFVGSAYYNDGRYYTGGRYQTGRYDHDGRQYTSRYYYNGQYVYGGRYQQYEPSRQTSRRDYTRSGGYYSR